MGCGRRLVDDAQNVQARDCACVFGRLPLRVVEEAGDGDDRAVHSLAQVRFSRVLHLGYNHRGDLLWGEVRELAVGRNPDIRPVVVVYDGVGETRLVHLHVAVGVFTAH